MKSSEVAAAVEAGAEEIYVAAEAKATSWLGKARAWFSRSTWKTKATTIVSIVILATVAINYLASGIEHLTTTEPAVVKATAPAPAGDIAKAQKDASAALASVADLTKTVSAFQSQTDELKNRLSALDEGVTAIIAEVRKLEEQVATLSAPKAKTSAKITTGSAKSRSKEADWSDPRSWLP